MSGTVLLAEFADADALMAAARRARDAGWRGLDAHAPFAVAGLDEALGLKPSPLRRAMLAGGLAGGAAAFALQWYSAVVAYPINAGGRPLASWQAFLVPAFEAAVIAAAATGVVGLLVACGLPRLHHPVLGAAEFGRASQDRFFLSAADPCLDVATFAAALDGLGALAIREAA